MDNTCGILITIIKYNFQVQDFGFTSFRLNSHHNEQRTEDTQKMETDKSTDNSLNARKKLSLMFASDQVDVSFKSTPETCLNNFR